MATAKTKRAFRTAGVRGLRTFAQALAGVTGGTAALASLSDVQQVGTVIAFGCLGALIAGVTAFLTNVAEGLE